MLQTSHSARRATSGFGLVEIMVGMVIGMLGIIIMMQVSTIFGAQKRSTSGGNEALSSGAIVMYNLQREIAQGGYGFSAYTLLGCDINISAINNSTSQPLLTSLSPVKIKRNLIPNVPANDVTLDAIPAGDPNTDTILLTYTHADAQTEGDTIPHLIANNYVTFTGNPPIYPVVIHQPSTSNPITAVSRPSCVGAAKLSMTVLSSTPTFTDVGMLYNLGQRAQIVAQAYAVRSNVLTRCDLMVSNCFTGSTTDPKIWVPIADNIVSMKAQYGIDTNVPEKSGSSTYMAVSYQNTPIPIMPTPNPLALNPAGANANCLWARVPAVRIALVARNTQYEKTAVTSAAPVWAGSSTNAIDLSANSTWQNYRYALFENTIPIRNIAWLGVQSGC